MRLAVGSWQLEGRNWPEVAESVCDALSACLLCCCQGRCLRLGGRPSGCRSGRRAGGGLELPGRFLPLVLPDLFFGLIFDLFLTSKNIFDFFLTNFFDNFLTNF